MDDKEIIKNNNDVTRNKDNARDKIILFVIGVLVGAVISAGAFLISVNTLGANRGNGQMPAGTPPEMSNGQGPTGQNNQNGTNGQNDSGQTDSNNQSESNNNQNSQQNNQPPEKPSGDNNNSNSNKSNS